MIGRVGVSMVAVAVGAAFAVGLAGPAAATQVTVGVHPFACHASLTVVPGDIVWSLERTPEDVTVLGWEEDGSVSGSGVCQNLGSQTPLTITGTWHRFGGARDASGCPPADFSLSIQLGAGASQFQYWYEVTDETTGIPSEQVIGINPDYTQPVPFGTGAITEPVPTNLGVVQTDPAACAAWPTASSPPPSSFAAPPPFGVTADWNLFGPPVSTSAGLLSACLTVQGVLPRSCLSL